MKASSLGLFAAVGMVMVGGAVYTVTPAGGFAASPDTVADVSTSEPTTDERSGAVQGEQESLTQFAAGGTLKVEGRTGHGTLLGSSPGETYLMLEVKGDDVKGGEAPPVSLSIVIDKSGSMRGTRHQNAIAAAVSAVERLNDGDNVSVVAFDTRTETVVPLTQIQLGTRARILSDVRGIQLGGDTCISCGIEEGLTQLRGSPSDNVQRMILLSDGDANNGVRDEPGFRSIAERSVRQGVSITTIGVDLAFNEKILAAIAQASNGRHYFVENDSQLQRVFEQEAESLTESVATSAVADIELAPGVELVQVFDRNFNRSGSRISVPLGSFGRGELKTVLVKVRVPGGGSDATQLAKVNVAYRDLIEGKDQSTWGKLGVTLASDSKSVTDIDAVVLDRVQRSETASALREANTLFSLGKSDEARRKLEQQQVSLRGAAEKAKKSAPKPRALDVANSFDKQDAELSRAQGGFASPPASEPSPSPGGVQAPARPSTGNSNSKKNAEVANDFGL